jgi:pimeloyl-ACP methyl ester carboxylesterase
VKEPKSGYAQVNGLTMYYEIHGAGKPLVLIHGGGSTIGTSFGKIIPTLALDFNVVAVELQGHGHTSDRDAPENFEQDADDVVALLHHLKIEKASFLGFSNGGNTAIQLVNRYPGMVDKLILASTFYKRDALPAGFFQGMKQATLSDMPQALKDAFLAINPDPRKLETMFTKDRERMLNFKDWDASVLTSIQVPTLVINGDRDVISASHATAMTHLIPNSRLLILPATHGAYLGAAEVQDEPALREFAVGVIKKFLETGS